MGTPQNVGVRLCRKPKRGVYNHRPPLNRAEKMVNKSIPAPDMHTCAKNTLGKNIGKYWGVKRNSGKTPLKPTKLGTAPL
jgi:hypothetical protein